MQRRQKRKAPAEVPVPRLMMKQVHPKRPAQGTAKDCEAEKPLFADAAQALFGLSLVYTHGKKQDKAHNGEPQKIQLHALSALSAVGLNILFGLCLGPAGLLLRGLFGGLGLLLFLLFGLCAGGLFGRIVGAHKAFRAIAYKVLSAGGFKRFDNELSLFRALPLQKGALHGLFMEALCNIHALHGDGVNAGIVHTGGDGAGGGIKVLHLLGLAAGLVEKFRQSNRVFKAAARVRAHQIGNDVLLLAVTVVESAVLIHELLVHIDMRLAHVIENGVDAVLGGDFELA